MGNLSRLRRTGAESGAKRPAAMVWLLASMMVVGLLTLAAPAAADGHCTTYRSGGDRTEKVAPHSYESVTIRSNSGSITYTDVRRGDVLTARNGEVFIDYTVCRYEITYGCVAADQDRLLFQIGTQDTVDLNIPGGWKAFYAATEYPANDAFAAGGATFTVVNNTNPTPDFPGYLAPMRMSEILAANPNVQQDRPLTNAAPSVTILWSQCGAANVTLEYGRYGTESDDVTLDGQTVAQPVSEEDVDITETYDLGRLAAGKHELTISYVGGGQGNGHYIDFLRFEATP